MSVICLSWCRGNYYLMHDSTLELQIMSMKSHYSGNAGGQLRACGCVWS